MSFTTVLNIIFTFFAALGGLFYLIDNRFGIGAEFEKGLKCASQLFLCMVGFMTLADWLSSILVPLVSPLLTSIGADPSLIAGILLSCDSGGAVMAKEMALDPQAALLNGYFVGSMFGSALNGLITLSLLAVTAERRKEVLLGLAMGIASIPFGCTLGGLLAGFSVRMILLNMLPLLVLSLVLVLAMLFAGDFLLKVLKIFGSFNILLCITGVIIAALGELCGIEVLPSRMPFAEIMGVIGTIVLVLLGVFPCLGFALHLLDAPLRWISEKTHLSLLDVKGIPINSVNSFPAIDQLPALTDFGILINCAFSIGAGFTFGDHFAYVSTTAPELALPLIAGKLSAGALGVLLVYLIFGKKYASKTSP